MTRIIVDISFLTKPIIFSRLSYVLDFMTNHPCSPNNTILTISKDKAIEDIKIYYSDILIKEKYCIKPNGIFFLKKPGNGTQSKYCNTTFNGLNLQGFCADGSTSFMAFDVFETIFFHISRYEEWNCSKVDEDMHGTMKSSFQYLVKQKMHKIPLVDHLVYYFYASLGLQPKKLDTTFSLTHDIDVIKKYSSLYKFLRGYGNILLYQKNKTRNILRHTAHFLLYKIGKKNDPYDTFDWLLIGQSKAVQKVIFFLTGGKTKYEGFFDIRNPFLKKIMEKALVRGYTIGLHPSYDSMRNDYMVQDEWKVLSEVAGYTIKHSRQHFLRFDPSITGKIVDKNGFDSDSSIGFRNLIGFRCGTGFPYHLYDFDDEKAFKFREIPLIVMDVAGMHECGWKSSNWIELLSDFISKNSHYTHITFNFHNSFFDPVLVEADLIKQWYLNTFQQ